MPIDRRRQEIASFLRTRRERLQPEEVDLPRGPRRRTPGLRREEVASLASVSTEWYKWLEQARDVRASPGTLQKIAGALRLEPSESRHLLTLAGYGLETGDRSRAEPPSVSARLQRLLDHFEPWPAWIHGQRGDMLAWNRTAAAILGDFASLEGLERNCFYQVFMNGKMRTTLVDWQHHAKGLVGTLRTAYAQAVDDGWFKELIDELTAHSPEFAAWWSNQDIKAYQDGQKHYEVPQVGRLSFEFTAMRLTDPQHANLSLITYVPMEGTGTKERLMQLLARTKEH